MDVNENTVIDYRAMVDPTEAGAPRSGRRRSARSYALLAALVVGLLLVMLVVALIAQSARPGA